MLQYQHAIGVGRGEIEVVQDGQYSDATRTRKRAGGFEQVMLVREVERRRGLVEQQKARKLALRFPQLRECGGKMHARSVLRRTAS